jgi:hypothetical protein
MNKNLKYMSEADKTQWNNIMKQFPYRWKTIDLHIAVTVGLVVGLWVGTFIGMAMPTQQATYQSALTQR